MTQVLRKIQPPNQNRFTIDKRLLKNDSKLMLDEDIDERINYQNKIVNRHNFITNKAIDTALDYCSSSVRDKMSSIKRKYSVSSN